MKIVADENIPNVEKYFHQQDELVVKPGRSIVNADLIDADLLLVRSVTQVNQELLQGTTIKFIGSTTTGTDHLDTAWLAQAGIPWCAAEGSNAAAVVEYIICTVAALQKESLLTMEKPRAAVIGAGRIGAQVAKLLEVLGFDVVICDPVRAAQEKDFNSTALEALTDLDLITLHTPLTKKGLYATYHMINKAFLQRQKKNCVLLNTSRGAVIDFSDLALYGESLYWGLDVWEHEPAMDIGILGLTVIATPHIAGYSIQSKLRGIDDIYQIACKRGVIPAHDAVRAVSFPTQTFSLANRVVDWRDVVLKIYDPRETTKQMQQAFVENDCEETFDKLRKQFSHRHEFQYVTIVDAQLTEQDLQLLKTLGIIGFLDCAVN